MRLYWYVYIELADNLVHFAGLYLCVTGWCCHRSLLPTNLRPENLAPTARGWVSERNVPLKKLEKTRCIFCLWHRLFRCSYFGRTSDWVLYQSKFCSWEFTTSRIFLWNKLVMSTVTSTTAYLPGSSPYMLVSSFGLKSSCLSLHCKWWSYSIPDRRRNLPVVRHAPDTKV